MTFQISVIIPVYNAAIYVTQAVESALAQPETAEVLLIEDGSPDNSLEVCQDLEKKYSKVKLLRHPDGENRGAGASRNLGMKTAKCDLIAFLDADDFYLPDRFSVAGKLFADEPLCEGVYEAIGSYMESEFGLKRWQDAGKPEDELFTINEVIPPENLTDALISGKNGSFHLNGLVFKKSVLDRAGFMDERLALHQDTEFILRLSMVAHLLPGRLDEPVALRRLHERNRISAPRTARQKLNDRLLMWDHLYKWCRNNSYDQYQKMIMPIMLKNVISKKRFLRKAKNKIARMILRLNQLVSWLIRNPQYFFDACYWQSVKAVIRN